MDGTRFDALTKRLATGGTSRRRLLWGLGGGLLGALLDGGGALARNCRQPDQTCPPGHVCFRGICLPVRVPHCGDCSAGERCCDEVCLDITGDPNNCGGCGITCFPGQICDGGKCTCPPSEEGNPLVLCGAEGCVDLQTSSTSCGHCRHACAEGQLCSHGHCCPADEAFCNGRCISTQTDPQNCGDCGNSCPPAGSPDLTVCAGGLCCTSAQGGVCQKAI